MSGMGRGYVMLIAHELERIRENGIVNQTETEFRSVCLEFINKTIPKARRRPASLIGKHLEVAKSGQKTQHVRFKPLSPG